MIFKNPVKIYSDAPERRDAIVAGVSYDSDLERSTPVIHDAVALVAALAPGRPVEVLAIKAALGKAGIDKAGIDKAGIDKAGIDKAGIEIPFPCVTHTFKESLPLERPRKAA